MEPIDRITYGYSFGTRSIKRTRPNFRAFLKILCKSLSLIFRKFGLMEIKVIVVMMAIDQTREYTIRHIRPKSRGKRKQMLQKSSKKISRH